MTASMAFASVEVSVIFLCFSYTNEQLPSKEKGEALALSLDIVKIFDQISLTAVLSNLPSHGLSAGLCTWIANFLFEWGIKVFEDGLYSDTMFIDAGVLQGSVPSPTLFVLQSCILFFNDILLICGIHCYADDRTGAAHYKGRANMSRPQMKKKTRQHLVSKIEISLEQVSEWG